jgi:endonuclease YncB( thermonuclease family)
MTGEGLARIGKRDETYNAYSDSLSKLMKDLKATQDKARSSRKGIWVYGEIPEEDED